MYQRKKINKGVAVLIGLLALVFAVVGPIGFYVYNRDRQFQGIAANIANLPEVESVLAVSEFVGADTYLVAKVRVVGGEEHVYFIQDNLVVSQLPLASLRSPETVMEEIFGTTNIVRHTLGRFEGAVIYELVANTAAGVNYVIADAVSGEILLSFVVD